MLIVSAITPLCLSVVLFAPALKARFGFNDLTLFFIPAALYLGMLAVFTIARPVGLSHRVLMSLWFSLLVIPCYIAWFHDWGGGLLLLIIVAINAAVGMSIVLFPWNSDSFEVFLYSCALLGFAIALNSIMFYGDHASVLDSSEMVQDKYLPVAMAAGIGSIASLYLVAKKFSAVHIGLFIINWIGLALSRGRGAVLICAAVCVVYMIVLFFSQISTLSRIKKLALILGSAFMAPFIISKLLLLNTGKWNRMFFDVDRELDEGSRGYNMSRAVYQILESPITGNGLGEYSIYGVHPHNLILQYGVDSGVVGMLLVLVFFGIVLRLCILSIRYAGKADANLALALTGLFVYAIGNFMKSGDAYLGRDWFILSALPICFYCTLCLKHALQKAEEQPP